MRGHLARGVSLGPSLLLIEHPTAAIPEPSRAALADDIVRVADARRTASLIITLDQPFAMRVAHRTLTLNGATGVLTPLRTRWFG
jgi:ABC-type iron transport system FetAB ATPase subunit